MEKKEIKKDGLMNENSQFKERFQFILSVNDNIICQRYFKVNGYNKLSIESFELKDTLDEIVDEIKEDLVSKSRVYLWHTFPYPVKMNGFMDGSQAEYLSYPDDVMEAFYDDDEKLDPYDVTFKFSFLVDEHVVYERIWDGTVYPRYVRNSVDITNSISRLKPKEGQTIPFSVALPEIMSAGRKDLVYHFINKLCGVLSNNFMFKYGYYTTYEKYGDKLYYYSLYMQNKDSVDGWRDAVMEKTRKYNYGNPSSRA